MKNEAKTGLRGEQGGDEERCEHACKCDAFAVQSLVSEIASLFSISILELIITKILDLQVHFLCRNQIKFPKDFLEVCSGFSSFMKLGLSVDLNPTQLQQGIFVSVLEKMLQNDTTFRKSLTFGHFANILLAC